MSNPKQQRIFSSQDLKNWVYLPHEFVPDPEKRPLSSGGFANIRICYRKDDPSIVVAVKTMRYSENEEDNARMDRALQKDITHLRLCRHPNILEYMGLTAERSGEKIISVGIVCTYAKSGSLSTYLSKNPDVNRYKILQEVAAGLAYLHSPEPEIIIDGKKISIVHGDVHPGNVLIMSAPGKNGDAEIKAVLADFGLSKTAEEGRLVSATFRANGADGVDKYLAPEVHRLGDLAKNDARTLKPLLEKEPNYAGRRTDKADVFAFGMLMYTTLGGDTVPALGTKLSITPSLIEGLRPGREDIKRFPGKDSSGKELPPETVEIEDDTWELICKCWNPYASKRPTMNEVCSRL